MSFSTSYPGHCGKAKWKVWTSCSMSLVDPYVGEICLSCPFSFPGIPKAFLKRWARSLPNLSACFCSFSVETALCRQSWSFLTGFRLQIKAYSVPLKSPLGILVLFYILKVTPGPNWDLYKATKTPDWKPNDFLFNVGKDVWSRIFVWIA